MTNKEIGEHVAAFMAERGWSEKKMAQYCEVMPCQVRDAIAAKSRKKIVLARIARKVGLDIPGLTTEGKRERPPRKRAPNPLRDLVEANGHTWVELADELDLNQPSELNSIGATRPVPARMLEVFEEFTGLTHEELVNISLSLCKSERWRSVYISKYIAHFGCRPDGTPAVTTAGKRKESVSAQAIRIPCTVAGIENEMERIREEAPADETPEQKAQRIELLDTLWRARKKLKQEQENAG